MATKTLQVVITGDAKGAQGAFASVETAAGSAEAKLAAVAGRMDMFGDSALQFGKKMTIGATLPIAAVAAFSVKAASDLSESQNKVEVVFGKSADSIEKWADDSARSFGLAKSAAFEAVGTFGNLFRSMDIATPTAAKMSKSLVQLAADLASFNNVNPEDALLALRSGLVGEVEPLRKFGVSLSAARVEAKALELGLAGSKEELTAGAKAQAAYAIIMEDTKLAQGDFARTSGGLANQLRIAKAELTDSAAAIGQILIPAALKAVGVFSGLAITVASLPTPAKNAVIAFAALLAVVGPLSFVIGGIAKGVSALIQVFIGVSAVTETFALKILYAVDALKALSAAQLVSFGALGIVLGGLAALVIALGTGRSRYEEITDAAKRWADIQTRNATAVGDNVKALGILKDRQALLAISIQQTQAAIEHQDELFRTGQQTIDQRNASLQNLQFALAELKAKHDDLGPSIDKIKQSIHEARIAEEARKANLNDLATGTTNVVTATDDAIQALQQLQSQILAMSGGEIGYQQALINREKAQRDLDQAIREHGPLSEEARAADLAFQQAQLQAASAALGFDDSVNTLKRTLLSSPEAFQAEIDKLEESKRLHPEVAEAIQTQINKLLFLRGTIESIPADKPTRVTADTSQAQAAVDRYLASLDRIRSMAQIFIAAGGSGQGEFVPEGGGATGAIINRPTLALLGEAGPEVLMPLDKTPGNSPLPTAGVSPASTQINIGQIVSPRPEDVPVEIARRRRVDMWLSGR